MATINDVATLAGVGIGTVSRVLNDSHQVRPETRAKVLAAMEELGYRPSRTKTHRPPPSHGYVGVVVPFFEEPSVFQRLRGIVGRLQPNGFEVVLYNVDAPDRARRLLMELPGSGRVDGLIVITLPMRADEGERLAEAPFPTVLVDTWHPALPSVTIDDVNGGRIATNHLLDLGHDRIGFVGEPPRSPLWFVASRLREQGYGEALRGAGLELRPEYVKYNVHLRSAARQGATELFALSEPPTGIVTASDVQATGVIEAARATGRRVPEMLSIVGYDDIELASHIGLTTVRQPLEESGQRGAEILLGELANGKRTNPFNERLQLELVVRGTTGPAPASNGSASARRNRSAQHRTEQRGVTA